MAEILLACMLSVSGVSILLFVTAGLLDNGFLPSRWKRAMLFVEFLGLFYYILSMLFTAAISGGYA